MASFKRTLLVVLAVMAGAAAAAAQPATSGCVTCHAGLAEARYAAPAADFGGTDVHRERGFTCVDCHGGDARATDKALAKAPATLYRGKPSPQAVVAVCSRCHSDAAFMRKFAPRQRVDQAVEFAASVHGQRLATGDTAVATCTSCHGAHGIRLVSDARSPVFPLNVAGTCARCHADPAHMKGYTLPGGEPLPTTQVADYETSVHFAALTKANDLSAPTCNDCHGNHGAAPPGAGSVVNVCGTCHTVFATKFALSTHSQIFDRGCVECHGNHAVLEPSDTMIGTSGDSLCAGCHSDGDSGFAAAGAMRREIDRMKAAIDASRALVARAANAGMEMSDQELALREAFNHLTLARTEVHTFDPAAVSAVLSKGLAITTAVDQAATAALEEWRFRWTGLVASVIAILVTVVALFFKVRALDRDHGLRA
ncbi:MAG: cytochrome c3 family protein [Acidobacteriota bacterium]